MTSNPTTLLLTLAKFWNMFAFMHLQLVDRCRPFKSISLHKSYYMYIDPSVNKKNIPMRSHVFTTLRICGDIPAKPGLGTTMQGQVTFVNFTHMSNLPYNPSN